jgi:uncharacterized protein (DUF2132 family)
MWGCHALLGLISWRQQVRSQPWAEVVRPNGQMTPWARSMGCTRVEAMYLGCFSLCHDKAWVGWDKQCWARRKMTALYLLYFSETVGLA